MTCHKIEASQGISVTSTQKILDEHFFNTKGLSIMDSLLSLLKKGWTQNKKFKKHSYVKISVLQLHEYFINTNNPETN